MLSPSPESKVTPITDSTSLPAGSSVRDGEESDVAAHLKSQEARWEGSFATHDVSVTEELVADDFVGTSSGGKVGTKASMIAEIKKDQNVYSSSVSEEMTVHAFGPDVAVVTGVARETGKTAAGKPFSQAYRFTDTWVKREGKWQCVAASALAMPKTK